MRAIVLDQATVTTGFAIVEPDENNLLWGGIRGQLIQHGRITTPSKANILDRLSAMSADIFNLIKTYNVQEMVVEDHRHILQRSAITNQAMASALMVCQEVAKKAGIPLYYQHPSHIKSLFTGNGNADKEAVIESVLHIWQMDRRAIKDDNHADALAAAYVWLYESETIRQKQNSKRKAK